MFTEFSISSMHMKTTITFLRISTPRTPIEKTAALSAMYHESGIINLFSFTGPCPLVRLFLGQDNRPDHRHQKYYRSHLEREQEVGEEDLPHHLRVPGLADRLDGVLALPSSEAAPDKRGHQETAERYGERRHHRPALQEALRAFHKLRLHEHYDEEEKDHDGARVDEHLYGRYELRVEHDVYARYVEEERQHEQRAVDRLPADHYHERAEHDDRREICETH